MVKKGQSLIRSSILLMITVSLVGTSFFFVHQSLRVYLERKTQFSLEISPLTKSDVPSVTICFEHENELYLEYGRDYNVTMLDDASYEEPIRILSKGKNDLTDSKRNISLALEELVVCQFKQGVQRICNCITPTIAVVENSTAFPSIEL